MVFGLLLIAIGVAIALYPQFLVAAIAGFFILSGVIVLSVRAQMRRSSQATFIRKLWG